MSTDLVTIIKNLNPMQSLIAGFAYLLGILFFITAIKKFKKIGDKRGHAPSQEKMFSPVMYMLMGAFLVYLPSVLEVMANTAFGVGNIMSYAPHNPANIYNAMVILIRTAGLLWFVRGCVLITHASEPGAKKEGPKGLLFLFAGILAMNFQNTMAMLDYIMTSLIDMSKVAATSAGY
jgi:hypothetical protein